MEQNKQTSNLNRLQKGPRREENPAKKGHLNNDTSNEKGSQATL